MISDFMTQHYCCQLLASHCDSTNSLNQSKLLSQSCFCKSLLSYYSSPTPFLYNSKFSLYLFSITLNFLCNYNSQANKNYQIRCNSEKRFEIQTGAGTSTEGRRSEALMDFYHMSPSYNPAYTYIYSPFSKSYSLNNLVFTEQILSHLESDSRAMLLRL